MVHWIVAAKFPRLFFQKTEFGWTKVTLCILGLLPQLNLIGIPKVQRSLPRLLNPRQDFDKGMNKELPIRISFVHITFEINLSLKAYVSIAQQGSVWPTGPPISMMKVGEILESFFR